MLTWKALKAGAEAAQTADSPCLGDGSGAVLSAGALVALEFGGTTKPESVTWFRGWRQSPRMSAVRVGGKALRQKQATIYSLL